MTANSKRPCVVHNATVYAPINKCNFIPSCSFERLELTERLPKGVIIRQFVADDGKHKRLTVSRDGSGYGGILWNTQTGETIHQEATGESPESTLAALQAIRFLMARGKRKRPA